MSPLFEPVQTALGDALPLTEIDFVVVDLETTGGSPVDDGITEIGAVRFHGLERIGAFQSLVDPERPIPPYIAHLTGIDDRLVAGAPRRRRSCRVPEFARGAVIRARTTPRSMSASSTRTSAPRLHVLPRLRLHREVARRLSGLTFRNPRPDVAAYFRTRTKPTHQRYDAEAIGEVAGPASTSPAISGSRRWATRPRVRAAAAALRQDRARAGASASPASTSSGPLSQILRRQSERSALAREVLFLRR
jgi:hypothetical protein